MTVKVIDVLAFLGYRCPDTCHLPTGEEILMTFNIKGFNKPLKVSGEIAHANDAGIGVKFKDLNPHVADKLENVVIQMRD
jgi:Tfp pilus assembly protein PilZ